MGGLSLREIQYPGADRRAEEEIERLKAAIVEAEARGFRRGEEAMRQRCAQEIARWGNAVLMELPLSGDVRS